MHKTHCQKNILVRQDSNSRPSAPPGNPLSKHNACSDGAKHEQTRLNEGRKAGRSYLSETRKKSQQVIQCYVKLNLQALNRDGAQRPYSL